METPTSTKEGEWILVGQLGDIVN